MKATDPNMSGAHTSRSCCCERERGVHGAEGAEVEQQRSRPTAPTRPTSRCGGAARPGAACAARPTPGVEVVGSVDRLHVLQVAGRREEERTHEVGDAHDPHVDVRSRRAGTTRARTANDPTMNRAAIHQPSSRGCHHGWASRPRSLLDAARLAMPAGVPGQVRTVGQPVALAGDERTDLLAFLDHPRLRGPGWRTASRVTRL